MTLLLLLLILLLLLLILLLLLLILLLLLLILLLLLLILLLLLLILLLLLLILLLLLLILLLLLLFFLFLEIFEHLFDNLPILLRLLVLRIKLQRFGVMLDGILPISFLFFTSFSGFATTHESVSEIVGRIFTQLWIPAQKRLRKMIHRLGKIPKFIGGGSSVEMEFVRLRSRLQTPFEVHLGLFEMSSLILLESSSCGGERNRKTKQNKGGRASTKNDRPSSVAEKQPKNEQSHRHAQRPLITFDRLSCRQDSSFRLVEFENSVLKDIARCLGAQWDVKTSSRLRNLLQPLFVKLALHRLSGSVANEIGSPLVTTQGNERAFRGANANGKNTHAELASPFRSGNAVGIQFLAVGQDNESARLPLPLSEGLFGNANRLGDVRSTLRNHRGVEFLERGEDRIVIQSQRSLEKGRARKGHQADAITSDQAQQILRDELGPCQPTWRHVSGKHAARGIDRDDHITATLLNLALNETHLRPSKSHGDKTEDRKDHGRLQRPPSLANGPRKL